MAEDENRLRVDELNEEWTISRNEINRWLRRKGPIDADEVNAVRRILELRHREAVVANSISYAVVAIGIALFAVGMANLETAGLAMLAFPLLAGVLFFLLGFAFIRYSAKRITAEGDFLIRLEVAALKRGRQLPEVPVTFFEVAEVGSMS